MFLEYGPIDQSEFDFGVTGFHSRPKSDITGLAMSVLGAFKRTPLKLNEIIHI